MLSDGVNPKDLNRVTKPQPQREKHIYQGGENGIGIH